MKFEVTVAHKTFGEKRHIVEGGNNEPVVGQGVVKITSVMNTTHIYPLAEIREIKSEPMKDE